MAIVLLFTVVLTTDLIIATRGILFYLKTMLNFSKSTKTCKDKNSTEKILNMNLLFFNKVSYNQVYKLKLLRSMIIIRGLSNTLTNLSIALYFIIST